MKDPGVKHQATLEHKRRRARARVLEVSKLEELHPDWLPLARRVETKPQRINFIISALRAGVYQRGMTTRAMAALWSIDEGTIADDEAEALRAVHRALEDNAPELLAEITLRIESIGRGALDRTEEALDKDGGVHEVRKPDYRTALAAAVELRELVAPRVHRLEVDVRTLSDEQIRAQLEEHGIRIVDTTAEPALPAAAGERA